MSNRVIKNYTEDDIVINDLGDLVIPSNGAIDVGGNEQRLLELSSSEDLLSILSMGTDKIQLNNGSRDLSLSEAIDLIRKVQRETEHDMLGRWIVRSESRRTNWDTAFHGAGDNLTTGKLGEGQVFEFDFSLDPLNERWIDAPVGYKRQSIKWNFLDPVYVKEGKIYYSDIPFGSYIDFYVGVPQGYPYDIKDFNIQTLDVTRNILTCAVPYLRFAHWVNHYNMAGTNCAGDELKTEAATEVPAYPFHIFEASITIKEVEGWQQSKGFWNLILYKPRTMIF